MNIHQTHEALPDFCRVQSCAVLKKYLAAALDLHHQVQQARRHVRGPGLIFEQEMFDKVLQEVEHLVVAITERAGYLGATVQGTIQVPPKDIQRWPYLLGIAGDKQHIIDTWEALASFARSVRDGRAQIATLNDPVTVDLFIEVVEEVDQQLCLVEAQLAHR